MAKFLTTVGNSFYIEQIIINAEKKLTLVTPYLNLSKNLIDRLADADRANINITLIYGKNELNRTEKKKIESLKNIEIYFCQNLHAKCYLNEKSLIITSMNLYEFSERNNREMGILIEKDSDNQIFQDTLKEIESIKNSSELEKSPIKTEKNSDNQIFQDTLKEIEPIKNFSELEKSPIKTEIPNLIYLSDQKNERQDFYHPSLYRVLKHKFPNYIVQHESDGPIIIEDFPIKGIELWVNGRIDFNFEDKQFFNFLKNNFRKKVKEASPDLRFYWNNYCMNIYPERSFDVDVNIEGLEKIVNKFLEIIESTKEQLTIANTRYN